MAKTARKMTTRANRSGKTNPRVRAAASPPKTKSAIILALLGSKDGTTIAEIIAATGWQRHSVRGFLSGTVKKVLGREITSVVVEGERRYRIAV